MADKLRCAVVGAGSAGLEHLHSLASCHRAAAVAIAESHPQRARESAARHHIARSYADYRELLEQPDIDAVTIATPTHLHAGIALEALKARKHVYLEAPMTLNAKEATKIVETARGMKRMLMVAHPWRFNRHTQMARAVIERGDAGEIYHARGYWLKRAGIPRIGSWYTQKQLSGGGCLADLGVPLLDTALYLMREYEIVSVSAQTHARFGPRHLGEGDVGRSEADPKKTFDVEDGATALVRLKSGRSILLETAWACFQAPDAKQHGLELFGSSAGLSLYPLRHIRHTIDGDEVIYHGNGKPGHVEDGLHHFVACVLDGKKSQVSMDESLKLRYALDALYASAATGKEVAVRPLPA
jgi:predicted dehydrogenase